MAAQPHEGPHEGQMQEGTQAPAGEHEAGGLPQFDFSWWPGQILWFLVVFFVVLIFMRLFAVPKIGGAIDTRKTYIRDQLADARRMKEQADAEDAAAAAEAAQARAGAQRLAAEARAKAQAEVAAKLAEEEAKLADAGAKA